MYYLSKFLKLILDCYLSKMSRQYGRQPPRNLDVKARTRTMNKFVALDPDVASNYEDLDEIEGGSSYRYRGGGSRQQQRGDGRGSQLFPKKMLSIIDRQINRKDVSVIRTTAAGTHRRDPISLITVKNASRSGKDHILKLLADSVDQFLPIAPRIDENGDLLFYILTEDDAAAVASMSKRIADKYNPNMKYMIYKNRKPSPFDPLNNASRQVIEQILNTRYNQITNSLDLSNFQNDPLFEKNRESPKGLFHNNVMVAVADYVSKKFGEIQGIRLNNNSLRNLDFVSTLVYAAPNVVELDLANNAISRIEELSKLSGWKLERVHFENNEFAIQFANNFSAYTIAVHEHFPFVNYLDGVQVHIATDAVGTSTTSVAIPKFKAGFHTDDSVRRMIENFLVEYYSFYDGINGEQTRQQLINAYDPNATFSHCICTVPDAQFVDRGDQEIYQQYMRNSHNIINQQKWQSFRDRLTFRGPMDIAVALSKLPVTEHVKQSFLLDFNLVSNNLVVVTLQGILRDGKDNIGAEARSCIFKFFVRQFVIIPKAEGLAILSDMIQLTPINAKRMEHYNNLLKNAANQVAQRQLDGMAPPPPSPQQIQEMAFSSGTSFIKQEPSTSTSEEQTMRREMVKQFCLFSGMKPEWSEKCLQDCSWNWTDAQKAFGNIKNQIPPEAFAPL